MIARGLVIHCGRLTRPSERWWVRGGRVSGKAGVQSRWLGNYVIIYLGVPKSARVRIWVRPAGAGGEVRGG